MNRTNLKVRHILDDIPTKEEFQEVIEKVKLTIIDVLSPYDAPTPPRYFITEGHIDEWTYTPVGCDKKPVKTVFE